MADKLNLRPSERRLLVVVGAVLFVVVNIWFVWPHFGDLGRVRNKRANALSQLKTFKEEIDKKAERQAEVSRLESATASVARQNQVAELMQAVVGKASEHGVRLMEKSSLMTRTNEFFVENSQNIRTVSGESELIGFLYDLGSSNSTIRVRDLTVRPEQPQRYKLSSNIKLVSSYRATAPGGKKQSRPATSAKK